MSIKITFSSGFCARHCNNGKRKRKTKRKSNKPSKLALLEQELKNASEDKREEPTYSM